MGAAGPLVAGTGVGNHQMMACQFFRWTMPRQIITSGSLGPRLAVRPSSRPAFARPLPAYQTKVCAFPT